MGSSFAAGPGLRPRAAGAPLMAGRSQRNYAHLVAARLGLELRDQTYSGATIAQIARRADAPRHPAQVDAVDGDTSLVTVTAGGNDVGYIPALIAASLPSWLPARSLRATARASTAPGAADQAFERLRTDLEALCTTIRSRCDAVVVFTDYLTVLPADPAAVTRPLPPDAAARGRRTAARLTATISRVAAEQGCPFVSLAQASADYHAWSSDPWIRGFHLGPWGGAAYHPTVAGMAAAADLVTAAILHVRGS